MTLKKVVVRTIATFVIWVALTLLLKAILGSVGPITSMSDVWGYSALFAALMAGLSLRQLWDERRK